MNKKIILFISFAITVNLSAQIVQPAGLFSRSNYSFSQYADRTENNHNLPVRFTQQSYVIKGETVLGSPFLFWDWNNGKLKTPDGREYNFKFKYDVYNQAVHYNDGKDSMEINEPIAEFSLIVKENNGDQVYTFRKSEAFGKNKNKGFYEVVQEGKNLALLKYYKMDIISLTYNLGNTGSNKSFDVKYSYWLYIKNDKKLAELKNNFKDILNYSQLIAGQRETIDALNLNYDKEADAISLVKALDNL
jgi:hypothetical protein